MSLNSGTLWIVATPLGNPGDLSPRAREILATAHAVLTEDTRRAGLLFARCGLALHAPLLSFHDHNEKERLFPLLEELRLGRDLALISDAGTPLLSDPGYRLVRACRAEGFRVSPVPGPSAPLAALCASGLPPLPFVFLGFLPRKNSEHEALFASYAHLDATLIFFERKNRLLASLLAAATVLGRRQVCLARELTKTHEEFLFFPLDSPPALSDGLRGEITVLLGPPEEKERASREAVLARIVREIDLGGKAREVIRRVRPHARGWSSKEIYDLVRSRAISL
ncbi:MAG: 16S rRNA (cytidine(1402)-2'-O)-methyltransferase [Desulfovibrio sp.]|jgi:16S rRNA (cytidine1402-2'-O)-methyltransferase|nr:16S rRNA (cytidine(1402)-2'-O)-methyltransferase [Desulfovibrio sp.]